MKLPWRDVAREMLGTFVQCRNRGIVGMGADRRRNRIIEVLAQYPDRAPEIADKIIDVLDED